MPVDTSMRSGRVRTPTLLQMEMAECGAASLGIMLEYFGRVVPLADLRKDCGVSRDGSKASNVLKGARQYGLVAKGFKKDLDRLGDFPYPFIVFWKFNHFLVVEGRSRDTVFLNDPASGPRTVSMDEFDRGFTGVVLTMEPGPDFRKGGRRPSVARGVWQRLRGSTGPFILCALAALFLVLPGLAAPALTQVFIDNVLVRRMDDWARPIILGMAAATIVRGFVAALQLRLLRRLQLRLAVSMSAKFVWHLLHLPADYYAQRYPGEVSWRIGLNDKVADVLSGRLTMTVIDVFMMIFYGAVMFQFDRGLTATAIGLATLNFLILRRIARSRVDANQRLNHDRGMLNGTALSGLDGIRPLKASALEGDFFSRWSGHHAKVTNTQQSLHMSNQMLGLLPRFVGGLMSLLVLVVGGNHVIDGRMTLGMLVAFQSLTVSFLGPINGLLGLGSSLQELEGDILRLDDVLASPPIAGPRADNNAALGASNARVRLDGHVELRNVTFGYNPVNPPIIEGLSLTVRPGQRIALVGGTGSGKSTIARLIAGLHQPTSGEILFDGVPRAELPPGVITNSLALVDQEILLFGGSVQENLTLWDSTLRDRQIMDACKDAAIHDTLVALPGGYQSRLLEGAANLSGGQRQRLEIARALAGNPSVLILDEATSALDAETERLIDRNIRRRGCSVIVVAHRLSTIRDADEIVVLDRGVVVQRGTHEGLLAQGGAYAELISSEGGFLEMAAS